MTRSIVVLAVCVWAASTCGLTAQEQGSQAKDDRPNILLAMADDWGWPHAGAYGDPVVKTPTFDRLAREGMLFQHAYVSSPSCTPSRGALLTGQWHWRLEAGANLHCIFPDKFRSYPEMLQDAGYFVGVTGKAWGPGRTETPNRPIAGQRFKNFEAFLEARPKGKPFCFWLGSADPHRPYDEGRGRESGIRHGSIKLPACLPDSEVVRSDVADYYFEVQRFDTFVGDALKALEAAGELDNTVIVMTGDHGMPFPRGKGNLYDSGTRVPLAIRWGKAAGKRKAAEGNEGPGVVIDDFVSTTDLAPTFLALAKVPRPDSMTGQSLLPLLAGGSRPHPHREFALFGKERHVPMQEAPDMGGYPCRGIRTADYLFIRNFSPDRWPNGTPDFEKATIRGVWYGDCDNGPSKTWLIEHKDDNDTNRRLYELAFAKRPAEELYDLKRDPDQLNNVATDPSYAEIKAKLAQQLTDVLIATYDPRVKGEGEKVFESHPYLGQGPRHPSTERPEGKKRKKQG